MFNNLFLIQDTRQSVLDLKSQSTLLSDTDLRSQNIQQSTKELKSENRNMSNTVLQSQNILQSNVELKSRNVQQLVMDIQSGKEQNHQQIEMEIVREIAHGKLHLNTNLARNETGQQHLLACQSVHQ